jgi:hypothetical protein
VLVPGSRPLFDPREVEERFREVVAVRPLAALDLFPRRLPVRNVVTEAEVVRTEGIEHPARATFDA